MADQQEKADEREHEQGTGTQARSGRGKHGEEEPHRAHNEHTESHKGERRQSDSRR